MPVTSLLGRVRDDLAEVWDTRMAPDDLMTLDLALAMVDVESECGHRAKESVVNLFATLRCPEKGEHACTTAHLVIPVDAFLSNGGTEEVANDLWERLASSRMVYAADLETDPAVE